MGKIALLAVLAALLTGGCATTGGQYGGGGISPHTTSAVGAVIGSQMDNDNPVRGAEMGRLVGALAGDLLSGPQARSHQVSGYQQVPQGGGYRSSAEERAYREGYERERQRQQRAAERSAADAAETDARQGIYRPQWPTPGERAAYEEAHVRERKRVQRDRERAAERAGREAAQRGGW